MYAKVVSTLALVLSTSGVAIASSHYLITSTAQIKPSVLRTLHGARGPAGPAGEATSVYFTPVEVLGQKGATGETGARGLAGPRGERGKEGGELPWARYCTALGEVVRDLEFVDKQLKEHEPSPVGPTGLIDRQEAELQAKETTATALGQVRALSNC